MADTPETLELQKQVADLQAQLAQLPALQAQLAKLQEPASAKVARVVGKAAGATVGWRTTVFGLLLAVLPAALDYTNTVNWQAMGISPSTAAVIGVIIVGLRTITKTPIGKGTTNA